jgi:beta-alanine--pyruvate transaminase
VLRAAGDCMVLAPPFAATAEQITEMVDTLRRVLVTA